MVSGIDRYFQIVRCFRDEDPRADRAYGEFTQLDLEMSFVQREDVMKLTENLFIEVYEKLKIPIQKKPFPIFTYQEAIKKFGKGPSKCIEPPCIWFWPTGKNSARIQSAIS